MKQWFILPVMLVSLVVTGSAQAETVSYFANAPEQIVDAPAPVIVDEPFPSSVIDGSPYGYPFRSGCCEPQSAACASLWEGFCSGQSCHPLFGHCSFGKARGKSPLAKGGTFKLPTPKLTFPAPKLTCPLAGLCGHKGGGGKSPKLVAPSKGTHVNFGLFDWLQFGATPGKGQGKSGKVAPNFYPSTDDYPVEGYKLHDGPVLEGAPTPPPVIPTPTSLDNSAQLRWRGLLTPVSF